ncbi:MAG: response regulator transcription factor [Magnetococcus sp. WYHC-3]
MPSSPHFNQRHAMPRILLVDDDRELCSMLGEYLAGEGFTCSMAYDGLSGLQRALEASWDALVVDVMMPGMGGFELVKRLRERQRTPVLMLTARGEEVESILGLEIGADDYLTKPCNPRLLVARLRAVLRRSASPGVGQEQETLRCQDVTLQPGARKVTVAGHPVALTSAEFNLLHLLMSEAGRVVAKETLCQQGLGRRLTSYDRSVDLHISSLRRKLGHDAAGAPRIHTVRGVGYLYAISG